MTNAHSKLESLLESYCFLDDDCYTINSHSSDSYRNGRHWIAPYLSTYTPSTKHPLLVFDDCLADTFSPKTKKMLDSFGGGRHWNVPWY
jgi:hypothetical protein